ncbi:MAG: rRNA-processing protein bfr2 [Trizodia sp. TS-e1964]|nr:MAG: rRNA-processing protein bfr2 [Trizodia sp. TS-e1964]
MKKPKSLAEQIAALDDPAPVDFDPEEHGEPGGGSGVDSGSESSGEENAGREHYVAVQKSKLRRKDEIPLGPQYGGARISRQALLETENDHDPFAASQNGINDSESSHDSDAIELADSEVLDQPDAEEGDDDATIASDEAFGESDEEKFKGFTFRGSSTVKPFMRLSIEDLAESEEEYSADGPGEEEEEEFNGFGDSPEQRDALLASDSDDLIDSQEIESKQSSANPSGDESTQNAEDEEGEDDEESDEESDNDSNDELEDKLAQRAELRKLMGEEQKAVVATIAEAAKADVEKGMAVKEQRATFDSFLNIRIRLQKALIASNSLSADGYSNQLRQATETEAYKAAEDAALRLWSMLDDLRGDLLQANSHGAEANKKRKRGPEASTSSEALWAAMLQHEAEAMPIRKAVLEKWSAKVRTTTPTPLTRKLNNTTMQHSITDVLTEQLANRDRLIKRTKLPRSCAPLQAAQKPLTEHNEIFDDADFYQQLLKELVEQKLADPTITPSGPLSNGAASQQTAMREARVKKQVDTRASKGRKLRYTVHEKLQNFMAPEDRGTWEARQADELFSSLLGRRVQLAENNHDDNDMAMGGGEESGSGDEAAGLILFRPQAAVPV